MNRKICFAFLSLGLLLAAPTISVPPNLHTEGVPAIPASLMEQLDRYSDIRGAALLDWNPVKREMLISTRFGDVPQIHQVVMPGGARTQLTFFRDRTARHTTGRGPETRLSFRKTPAGPNFISFTGLMKARAILRC